MPGDPPSISQLDIAMSNSGPKGGTPPVRHQSKQWLLKTLALTGLFAIAATANASDNAKKMDTELLGLERPLVRSPSASGDLTRSADDVALIGSEAAAASATSDVLDCFQVAQPVLLPSGASIPSETDGSGDDDADLAPGTSVENSCSEVLMVHSFANSYGAPFVGNYTPPSCDFNRVVINLTVEVKGRQYDRLAVMYFGDTELWKTSTAEPTKAGIRWTYLKDMTQYLSLWKQPQTLIFDLPNIYSDVYTGILNTTLTATFFQNPVQTGALPPADTIIPISARKGLSTGQGSQFTVPEETATNTISNFPRNAHRAVFTLAVKAQGDEEQWFNSVPQSRVSTFNATYGSAYPGHSPWREVQVLIDGRLAGVQWPFPVVFTGGVVPQLHRPVVGVEAFDLREHEVDVTPWLPVLCDGGAHTFTIRVVGLDDDGASGASLSATVDSSWYVTGKVFIWLDDEGSITTGTVGTSVSNSEPIITLSQSVGQNSTGANETLHYDLQVTRKFSITSQITTQNTSGQATWSQNLTYSNVGGLDGYGWNNINSFRITGQEAASSPGPGPHHMYATRFQYPLWQNATADQTAQGNLTLWAELHQGLELQVEGDGVFPTGLEAFGDDAGGLLVGSVLRTWKNGTADYSRTGDNTRTGGVGETSQVFYFGGVGATGVDGELYYRSVGAYNDTVTRDYEVVAGEVTRDVGGA